MSCLSAAPFSARLRFFSLFLSFFLRFAAAASPLRSSATTSGLPLIGVVST